MLIVLQCALANSQLSDILWVSLDYTGTVLGILQTVSGRGICNNNTLQIDKDALEEFNTDVLIKRSEIGLV